VTGWIVMTDWDHYRPDGEPAIRLPVSLVHDDDFQSLRPPDRAALFHLWMLYARTGRKMRDDTSMLTRASGMRITRGTLERLAEAGFIDVSASVPVDVELAALRRRRAALRRRRAAS
jgi:hypothetical protein